MVPTLALEWISNKTEENPLPDTDVSRWYCLHFLKQDKYAISLKVLKIHFFLAWWNCTVLDPGIPEWSLVLHYFRLIFSMILGGYPYNRFTFIEGQRVAAAFSHARDTKFKWGILRNDHTVILSRFRQQSLWVRWDPPWIVCALLVWKKTSFLFWFGTNQKREKSDIILSSYF